MSDKQEYQGSQVTIYFEAKKCIHSQNCVLTLPDVFRANVEGSWVFPDNAEPEEIVSLAHMCPSGAITYKRHDNNKEEKPPAVNTVRILENGPLAVHADIQIDGQQPTCRATLCRCGASQNKPYCDGRHKIIEFEATGEPPTQAFEPLDVRGGPLKISPAQDGPLLVNGNVELIAGTGRTLLRTQQTALCRCGASKNKPYCDGSHVEIKFTTE